MRVCYQNQQLQTSLRAVAESRAIYPNGGQSCSFVLLLINTKAKMQKDPWGIGQLQTDPLGFQFRIMTTWGLWIDKIDTSTKQHLVFLSKITAT